MITTRMSANIVADLLKTGVDISQMAHSLNVSPAFIQRVQKKLHSFTYSDVKRLAKLTDWSPQLLIFNSVRPIRAEAKGLFESVREMLEVCNSVDSQFRSKTKKRGTKKAA